MPGSWIADTFATVLGWPRRLRGGVARSARNTRRYLTDTGLDISILLFTSLLGLVVGWFWFFPDALPDYRVEFVGLIYDVFFILVVLALFERRHQVRQDIKRQQETIEDYKRWDSEEARARLSGAIRRLNRLGVHKLDLTGIRLSDFSFADHLIGNLEGTVFYDGTWGEPLRPTEVHLSRVKFDWVNCQAVQFSPFNPLGSLSGGKLKFASLTDCTFIRCDLRSASFNGANMAWSQPPPSSHFSYEGDDEDGRPFLIPNTYGPFDDADLSGVSFAYVQFENADFRGARNLESADFTNATGLASAIFDTDTLKASVLRQADAKTPTRHGARDNGRQKG